MAGKFLDDGIGTTFVVRDDRIVRWTDYWDHTLMRTMMWGGDYSALVPRR